MKIIVELSLERSGGRARRMQTKERLKTPLREEQEEAAAAFPFWNKTTTACQRVLLYCCSAPPPAIDFTAAAPQPPPPFFFLSEKRDLGVKKLSGDNLLSMAKNTRTPCGYQKS